MEFNVGHGTSLLPLVPSGSVLGIDASIRGCNPGTLALYVQNRKTICHLILFKKFQEGMHWYFFKGNSLLHVDGWIPEYRLMGSVVSLNGVPVIQKSWRLRKYFMRELLSYVLFRFLFTQPISQSVSLIFQKLGYAPGSLSKKYSLLLFARGSIQ